jgi:hypothetical protein
MAVISWWQFVRLPWRRYRIVGQVDAADEIPDKLPHKGAVLVGPASRYKWIAFDCPCPQRHRLIVNLEPSRRPHWRIENPRRLTLRPSIDDRAPERRCHFVLRNGKITWTNNDRRTR